MDKKNDEQLWFERPKWQIDLPITPGKTIEFKLQSYKLDTEIIEVLDLYSRQIKRRKTEIIREALRQFIPAEYFKPTIKQLEAKFERVLNHPTTNT